jgi:predicted enzyme related to lactoylglutathione lyase
MPKPVVHFEIAGRDGGKLRDFYGKLFNWEYEMFDGGGDYGLVKAAGPNSIGGGIGSTPPGTNPYVTFYMMVDDLQASLKKAESLGGKTVLQPTPIPGMGAFAWFSDPEGNVLGIYKHGE